MHSITRVSLFQAMFEKKFLWHNNIFKAKKNKVFAAHQWALNILTMRAKLEAQFKKAAKSYVKYYNTKYQSQSYNTENKIFFNNKNIKLTRTSKKLNYKF